MTPAHPKSSAEFPHLCMVVVFVRDHLGLRIHHRRVCKAHDIVDSRFGACAEISCFPDINNMDSHLLTTMLILLLASEGSGVSLSPEVVCVVCIHFWLLVEHVNLPFVDT